MCDHEKENNHIGKSDKIGLDHVFNSNMDPKNHSITQDTSCKISSVGGIDITKKAASLLLHCAINIEQMILNGKTDPDNNDHKNGHEGNGSVINNMIIANHDSKNNTDAKDFLTQIKQESHDAVDNDAMNQKTIENGATKNNHELMDDEAVNYCEVEYKNEGNNNDEVIDTLEAESNCEGENNNEAINNHEVIETDALVMNATINNKEVIESSMTNMKYRCSLCKKCNTESDIAAHNRSHMAMFDHMNSSYVKLSRVEIFECNFCSSLFATKAILKEHQRKYYRRTMLKQNRPNHDPSKPYHCKVCGWSYRQKSTLNTHLTIHEPLPHACECGVAFYREEDLESHRRLLSHHKPKERKLSDDTSDNEDDVEADSDEEQDPDISNQIKNKRGPQIRATLQIKQSSKGKKSSSKSNKKKSKNTTSNITEKKMSKSTTQKTMSKNTTKRKRLSEKSIECRVDGNTVFVERDEKGFYRCTLCDAAFKVPKYFRDHMQLKHGWSFDFMHTCDICGKSLASVSGKEMHMLVHTGEKPYPCPMCDRRFTQPGVVKLHIKRVHARVRDYACSMCPKKFSDKGNMENHERTHTGVKPYACRTCSKRFADPSACKRHELIHTGLKPYHCELCPKAFCDPAALFRHKRMHAGYNVKCAHCSRSFASRMSLRLHTRLRHSAGREQCEFECDHCGKKFPVKQYLAMHMNTHAGGKVTCDICGLRLRDSSMAKHVAKVHLKRYPHECQDCGKRYAHPFQVNRHRQREHDPEHPHVQCDLCQATYFDKVGLNRHMVQRHLGHKCSTCKKCFISSQCLRMHKKNGCLRCDVCAAPFATRFHKREHMATQHPREGQPLFQCGHCGKRFVTKSRLVTHIGRVHRIVADWYSCDDCGATFTRRDAIVAHIWDTHMLSLYCDICMKRFFRDSDFRSHKEKCTPQVYACEMCNKTFRTTCRLKAHRAVHGTPQFECHYCGNLFIWRKSLKRHIQLLHRNMF